MDIKEFIKLMRRYRWILILVPVVTAIITYFLVEELPKIYISESKIATGIVDPSKQVSGAAHDADYFKIGQQFGNIMEKMKMRKIMSILSYSLILHDLENPSAPFLPYSKKLDSLSATDKQKVTALFQEKLSLKAPITPIDKSPYKLYAILSSMDYDEISINKKLEISHDENSDFINVKFESPNPLLSAFVVNTLTTEFINNYSVDVNFNQNQNNVVLDSLLKAKERDMNVKNSSLKDFKTKNGVLNLDKQSELVFQQITQAEDKKAQVVRDIQANQGAINAIEGRLRSSDPDLGKDVVGDNAEIVNVKNQLEIANKRYVDGNFKVEDKKRIDSLTSIQISLTSKNSDKYVVDPQISKQNLLAQKYTLETTLAQLNSSVRSIDNELTAARAKYNSMVPFDAGISNYVRDADLATKDYLDALNRFNQTQTEQNIGLKLQIAEMGVPTAAEPSKMILFIVLSGIASFFICLSVLMVLFLMNSSIYTAQQLAYATKSKVLGNLNLIPRSAIDIKSIWNEADDNSNYNVHRDLLRALRFEINNQLSLDNSRILGITSLIPGEGKTFVSSNLAYAFAMTGKKVLLIAGMEQQSQLLSDTKQLAVSQNFETFLVKREIHVDDLITRLNKIDDDKSLLEIQNEKNLRSGFDILKKQFDLIIIDVNSLSSVNLAKEWLSFTEKCLAVFEAGKPLSDEDKELIPILKEQPGFMGFVLNKIKLTEINAH